MLESIQHFGSLSVLSRASVDQLLPFVSRSKALRLISSLRVGAHGSQLMGSYS
jgi:hypothetical protein